MGSARHDIVSREGLIPYNIVLMIIIESSIILIRPGNHTCLITICLLFSSSSSPSSTTLYCLQIIYMNYLFSQYCKFIRPT